MKVLAVNGSPRGEKGDTDKILQPLLEGMRQVGAETESVYLANKNIHHCIGCFSCWLKTPGQCVFKDDMGQILKKFIDADLIIFGTPLYYFTMTGLMKNFMDRLLPLALPFMEENAKGVTTHPSRYYDKAKKMVLVSGCGFPEINHFDALVATFKKISEAGEAEYLGEILKPAAGILDLDAFQHQTTVYRDLLKQAGKQLITNSAIDEKTHQALHQLWISPKEFRENANQYFKSELEKIENK